MTGYTISTNFPTTSGAYDTSDNPYQDVFVSKFDSGLTSLLASTYLGGNSDDESMAIALDASGYVYVTGYTASTDFPKTTGAYQTALAGAWDVFVSRLNNVLTNLLASTFLGGSSTDFGIALACRDGVVYVTGRTASTNFPMTSGAYDTSHNGYDDVFVSKLNSGLTSLAASTYLGGAATDYGRSIALNSIGRVFVTGYTGSTDFPTTTGAYNTAYSGDSDVFVSKLNADLTQQ